MPETTATTTNPDLPPDPPKRRAGAPKGNRNALKTGLHTAEMKDLRRRLRAFRARADALCARVEVAARDGQGEGG